MGLLLRPVLSLMQMLFSALQCREGRGRGEKSEGVRKAGAMICAKHCEMPTLPEDISESGGGGRVSSGWTPGSENLLILLDKLPAGNLWQELEPGCCLPFWSSKSGVE